MREEDTDTNITETVTKFEGEVVVEVELSLQDRNDDVIKFFPILTFSHCLTVAKVLEFIFQDFPYCISSFGLWLISNFMNSFSMYSAEEWLLPQNLT
jgi:hypothetical protein